MPDLLAQALATPGLIWLAGAVMVAGLVRGFSGFGSAMIIMPAASSVFSPVGAVLFLTAVELFGPLPNLRSALNTGTLADVARLGLGAMLALPVGIWVLATLSSDVFGWSVSLVVLVLLAVIMTGWRYRGHLSPRLITGTGALGGFLSGAVGIPGPPVIMLYMASTLPISVIRANFLMYLLMIDVLMIAVIAVFGLFQAVPVVAALVLILPYMLANALGALLFDPSAERVFRWVAYAIVAASALLGLPIWS
ncbi:MAG: sulfite exporter TauE/SafE family protein [Sedimentitalea sp.]